MANGNIARTSRTDNSGGKRRLNPDGTAITPGQAAADDIKGSAPDEGPKAGMTNRSGDVLQIGTQDKDKIISERKETARVEDVQEDIVRRRGTDTRGGSRASQVLRKNKEEDDDTGGASVSRRVLLGF